ncbi:hypothetical protein EJ06DRAFT_361428 [Trichodelitschia bisporula]|uniref:Autophagy-related protein 2 n=1 Tax=Trichodelitschia bisporula TaxID=703511 RepID=A0A6G1I0J9_9PEZI|nr:hypothetical protein EJ06DRAFT_361428 [Trichodelitschia bisporula]
MAFFIPSSIQKRLLRYALSRLELLDTDTLDLEQLDIAWGRRSSVELRDIKLHIKKISHVLHLPDTLQPTEGRILLLRVTVPADLHASGIVVEIKGVEIRARLAQEASSKDSAEPPNKFKPDAQPEQKARRGSVSFGVGDEQDDVHLPTTREVAQSFLKEEPVEERIELEEAMRAHISEADYPDTLSESSEEEEEYGTGTGLSLPTFLANFLKGIADRLEVSVGDVRISLDAELPRELTPMETPTTGVFHASIGIHVENVGIEGLTARIHTLPSALTTDEGPEQPERSRPDRRRLCLQNIQARLETDELLLPNEVKASAPVSAPPSPVAESLSAAPSSQEALPGFPHRFPSQADPRASSSTTPLQQEPEIQSVILAGKVISGSPPREDPRYEDYDEQVPGSPTSPIPDQDRFADASDEEDIDDDSLGAGDEGSDSPSVQAMSQSVFLGRDLSPTRGMTGSRDINEDQLYDSPSASLLLGATAQDPEEVDEARLEIPVRPRLLASSDTVPSARLAGTSSDHEADQLSHSAPMTIATVSARQRPPEEQSPPLLEDDPLDESLHLSRFVSSSSHRSSETSSPARSEVEDLSQSRIFTHEEAESMYLSAMAEIPGESSHYNIPGGWNAGSVSSNGTDPRPQSPVASATGAASTILEPGCETPRAGTPVVQHRSEASPEPEARSAPQSQVGDNADVDQSGQSDTGASPTPPSYALQLLTIDEISLWLPWAGSAHYPSVKPEPTTNVHTHSPSGAVDRSAYGDMPGAFSQHFSSSSGRRRSSPHPRFAGSSPHSAGKSASVNPTPPALELDVELGHIHGQIDFSTGRILFQVFRQLLASLSGSPNHESPVAEERNTSEDGKQTHRLAMEELSISFVDRMPVIDTPLNDDGPNQRHEALTSNVLFELKLTRLAASFSKSPESTHANLNICKFSFGFSDEPIISFDAGAGVRLSAKDVHPEQAGDVSITFRDDASRRSELHLETLPVVVSLNMPKLDEQLSSFGGLSGVLDLSSSVASNSTVLAPTPPPPAPTEARIPGKSVRFETGRSSVSAPSASLSPIKINARIAGLHFGLHGRACGVALKSSAMKLVVREKFASVQIDQLKLRGPHLQNQSSRATPVLVDVSNTKIIFLQSPEESDLTDLVSLITPSRDKYEDDDDILLDTLLRQRKKGSLLRVTVANVAVRVNDIQEAQGFQLLADEIAKISSVTKYLPEDDRPGILTLAAVETVEARLKVNEAIGSISLTCHRPRIAHVGLPALLAVELGEISARRHREELVTSLLHLQPADRLPMIMARLIGDEMEPKIKVKLFNVKAEYRVSTIMAAMGLSIGATTEDLAASMVSSVATLRGPPSTGTLARQTSGSSAISRSSPTPLHIDLLLRDCAIGLNPDKHPGKAILLFSNAHLATNVAKDPLHAKFEIRKASMLVIDDVDNLDVTIEPALRPRSSESTSPAATDLGHQGFKSVATISSADIVAKVTDGPSGNPQAVVNVTDRLCVLETCADSTRTMIDIMNGLAPPMPPRDEEQYRTNVVPIEDMMASFNAGNSMDEDDEPHSLDMDDEETDHLLEDLPSNMDFVGSFYDPEGEYAREDNDLRSVAGSRLSIASTATPKKKLYFSDSLQEIFECTDIPISKDPAEDYLEIFNPKGAARCWDSKSNQYGIVYQSQIAECPVQLHLTVTNFIWNLYDGYDWFKTRDAITRAVEDVQARVEQRRKERQAYPRDDEDEESEIGDFLFQSIWIAVPPNRDERDLRRQINRDVDDLTSETGTVLSSADTRITGRPPFPRRKSRSLKLDRSKRQKVSFELRNVTADVIALPPDTGETQCSITLRVHDLEIFDHVPTSTWKKFATYMHDAGERQMDKPMIRIEIINVKPIPELAASELVIKVNVLPLRLHVDQDALDFMTRFFEFKDENMESPESTGPPPFIQRLEVQDVQLKLDYKPKKVDYAGLRSGHTSEFMNFFILDGANILLKRAIIYGIPGFDRIHKILNDIWMPDVTHKQLPEVLSGLASVRPVVNVGSGVRDLVVVPMREYRKDGRLIRSIQKGAVSFARTTTSELARLGAKVAIGTQNVLQGAEEFLSPVHQSRRHSNDDWEDELSSSPGLDETRAVSSYADQPLNVVTGLRSAFHGIERDILLTRNAIIAVGGEVRDSSSAGGVARAVGRHAPTIILQPAIGATRAIGTALLGAGNTLDRDSRRKIEDVSGGTLYPPLGTVTNSACRNTSDISGLHPLLSDSWQPELPVPSRHDSRRH